jgi:hypothetical protein
MNGKMRLETLVEDCMCFLDNVMNTSLDLLIMLMVLIELITLQEWSAVLG